MPSRSRVHHGPGNDELFRLVVESSADMAIFTTDSEGITTSWNIGAERLFGYRESEILGTLADVIFTPEDRAHGAAEHERTQARTIGRALDDRWHQKKDGSRFWASGLLMPLQDEQGGFFKITRDRTEQHRANEQLRENEERFRLLATSIPQLVFRTLPNGDRTWGSPQWISFTGLSLEQSLGFGWYDAIHPSDRALTHEAWDTAQKFGEYYVEHRIRRAEDGAYRWHQTRAKPVDRKWVDREWVGTMTDIHDLRDLKDRQDVLMAELQHRTRNLLAVVQSIAAQTIKSSSSLDVFRSEFSNRLRALGRVQSLLARVGDNEVNLGDLVNAELEAHVEKNTFGKVAVSGPSITLPASAAQTLGLAFHELTTNAIKHGAFAQDAGKLRIHWEARGERQEPKLAVTWEETGVTMNTSALRRGYGSELIERALPYQLGAKTKLDFRSDGLLCSIEIPLNQHKS